MEVLAHSPRLSRKWRRNVEWEDRDLGPGKVTWTLPFRTMQLLFDDPSVYGEFSTSQSSLLGAGSWRLHLSIHTSVQHWLDAS